MVAMSLLQEAKTVGLSSRGLKTTPESVSAANPRSILPDFPQPCWAKRIMIPNFACIQPAPTGASRSS